MERTVLEAEVRPPVTRGQLKAMRRADKVPAVIYGKGKETEPLVVEGRALRQVLLAGGSNALIDLKIKQKGKKTKQETVMFKDIQRYMLHRDRILHVDFIRISMTEKIEVGVALNFTGEPAGVRQGGVLQILLREVTVRCLPADIPEHIDVDLSGLGVGESVDAGCLRLGEGVELITPVDEPLARVLAPAAEEEVLAEAVAGEAEAAEKTGEEEEAAAPDYEG